MAFISLPVWRSSLPDRMIQLVVILALFLILSVPQSCKAQGLCHACSKATDSPTDCMKNTAWTPDACPGTDATNVSCITYHAIHKGVQDDAERKKDAADRQKKSVQLKGCVMKSTSEDREKCVKEHLLDLNVKDGECKKGSYTLDILGKFATCTKDSLTIANMPKDGKYWGVGGNEEYADVTVCLCKGANCNTEDQNKIDKAPSVKDVGGSASLLESFGFTRILTTAIIIAVTVSPASLN